MTVELVNAHALLAQGLIAHGEGAEGGHDVHTHEVCDREAGVLAANEERVTRLHAHDRLA